jgi:transmembrane sensor
VIREALTLDKLSALEPDEAAAYFIARRAEGLASAEQQLLADWLSRNETHRHAFESADRAWQSFAGSEGDEILAAMRAHARTQRSRAFSRWRPAVAVAATLILAAGAALMFIPGLNPWAPESQPHGTRSGEIQYVSARAEVKNLTLPDGTHMTLDAESAAVGRFTAKSRTVKLLRGRAFFEVMPDRLRPFVVTAAGGSVVAVGTRFDVNLEAEGLTVTLVEGHVEIRPADPGLAPATLAPGQQYVVRLGKAMIRTIGAASENVVAWRVGLINFDDQTLADAAAVMNRYSRDQVVIRDPAVASIRVTGQFRAGDAQRFVSTLAELKKLRFVRRANEIEILGPE